MKCSKFRALAFGILILLGPFGSRALAHDDPREMGAGPGIAAASHHDADAAMANDPAMQELVKNGTMPTMADGSMPQIPAADVMADMGHDHDADNSDKSLDQRLLIWLGKLHVTVIHFPIAMIIGAFALELLGIGQRRATWRSAARIMLVVGAIGAVVAATLGWFAGGFYLSDRNIILTYHRYLGTSIAIASLWFAWAGLRRFHPEKGEGKGFAFLLGVLVIAVVVQAFLGGTFMHGGLRHMNF